MNDAIPMHIMDAVDQPVVITCARYKIQYANLQFAGLYNKKPEDISGMSLDSTVGKYLFLNYLKPLLDKCLNGESAEGSLPAAESSFFQTDFHVTAIPWHDRRGNVKGVITVYRNSGAFFYNCCQPEAFRTIVENSADIIYVTDLNEKFTFVSPSVERILGYKVEEVLNKGPEDLMTRESYENQLQAFKRVLDNPDNYSNAQERKELNLSENQREQYIDLIFRAYNQLMKIIEDVLSMARLESKEEVSENEPVELSRLVFETYYAFKGKAAEKKLTLRYVLPQNRSQLFIRSDENKISQILNNFLNNALKFTPEGGTIRFGYYQWKGSIHLFVEDNGIGIPKDAREKIFERFTQLDHSDKKQFNGTGLGLPISKALVELLGGTLQVESAPDEGSTFYLSLPFEQGG